MFTLFLPDVKQSYQNQDVFGDAAAVSPSCTLFVMVTHVLGLWVFTFGQETEVGLGRLEVTKLVGVCHGVLETVWFKPRQPEFSAGI